MALASPKGTQAEAYATQTPIPVQAGNNSQNKNVEIVFVRGSSYVIEPLQETTLFLGHFGVAFAAKKAAPKTSLGTLVLAAQFAGARAQRVGDVGYRDMGCMG